jgi:hypothetical protein
MAQRRINSSLVCATYVVDIENKKPQFLPLGLMDAADPSKESSFWLGMEVRFSSADNKIIGAYWLDGTSTVFGHPEMVEAGDYPWGQYKNQNPEPDYRNSNQIQPGVIFARDPDSIITPVFLNLGFFPSFSSYSL